MVKQLIYSCLINKAMENQLNPDYYEFEVKKKYYCERCGDEMEYSDHDFCECCELELYDENYFL